ncbi:FG-GAP repeat domain-containing protein, partial [Kiloniella spongiae]
MTRTHWDASRRNLFVLDYNGDGLPDILLQGKTDSRDTHLLTSTGNGYIESLVSNSWGMTRTHWDASRRNLFVLDYNGDGLPDILLQGKTDSRDTHLLTSTGNGYIESLVSNSWGMTRTHWDASRRNLFVLDYNGDGLPDILLQGKTDSRDTHLLTNTGNGYIESLVSNSWGMTRTHWDASRRNLFVLDNTGNGLSDILFQGVKDNRDTHLLTASDAQGRYISVITTPRGHQTSISYTPLTDKLVYSKGSDAVYPEQDYVSSLSVVQSVERGDGIGGTRKIE